MKCRIGGDALVPVIDLGNQFVSNFVDKGDVESGDRSPLVLGLSPKTGFLQLLESYPPEKMYAKYWYRSSLNEQMRDELHHVVRSCLKWRSVEPGDLVLDIASNDGIMLTFYPENLIRVGIDPSDVAWDSPHYGTRYHADGRLSRTSDAPHRLPTLIHDYFSEDMLHRTLYQELNLSKSTKAKIVTICAMFYDLEDPRSFLEQVNNIMDKNGLLAIQMSYMPLMLKQNAFDNIGHEHLGYYSFSTLFDLLIDTGFDLVDVELNSVNGGSFIVYAAKCDDTPEFSGERLSQPLHALEVGQARIHALIEYESTLALSNPQTYNDFMRRIATLREETLDFLIDARAEGKRVIGYGASTKGNTLLQYYGIGPDLIEAIAERSEPKFGKYTVGTGIPIISEDEMRQRPPDYLFVLPWTFINTMMRRESKLIEAGTRFVVPLPRLRIY